MSFRSLFDALLADPSRISARRKRARPTGPRLQLELLEDRTVPSFAAPAGYAAGITPIAVVTADFNGDGRLDIAVANNSDSTVSILLGNADGTFQAARNFATGAGPQSVAVGDFNSDGKLDLVTANGYDVSVLLGNGAGTFGAPTGIALSDGSSPKS